MTTRPSLFIGTPAIDAAVTSTYLDSLLFLTSVELPFDFVLGGSRYDYDLVRARSWIVADFLETKATHLLFIDSDVDFTPQVVAGLVATGKDYVCAPYRRKREQLSYPFVFTGATPNVDAATKCVELAGGGLGMTLLSRACLEKMTTAYAEDLTFIDERKAVSREGPHPRGSSVALFQLAFEDTPKGRVLHSEDFSLAYRWRALGGQCWLYLGAGVCGHTGHYRFAGDISHFKQALESKGEDI